MAQLHFRTLRRQLEATSRVLADASVGSNDGLTRMRTAACLSAARVAMRATARPICQTLVALACLVVARERYSVARAVVQVGGSFRLSGSNAPQARKRKGENRKSKSVYELRLEEELRSINEHNKRIEEAIMELQSRA